jgi:hypothetical protein
MRPSVRRLNGHSGSAQLLARVNALEVWRRDLCRWGALLALLVVGSAVLWTSGEWLSWPWLRLHPLRVFILVAAELLLCLVVACALFPGRRLTIAVAAVSVISLLIDLAARR